MQPFHKLAVVVNTSKPGAWEFATRLFDRVHPDIKRAEMRPGDRLDDDFFRDVDACCAIGGDGTILGIVPYAVRFDLPIIGINHGKLGFLSTYTQEEAESCLSDLVRGEYTVTRRSLLASRTGDGREEIALNDVVVKAAPYTGLVELRVTLNGLLVNTFSSDGLIFTTPTGSTAYNLAAGGPIMHPLAAALAMTPISPHTLSNRSVVFSSDATLTVTHPHEESIPQVSIDGRSTYHADGPGVFPLEISVSPRQITLIHHPGYDHFSIIRSKLKW